MPRLRSVLLALAGWLLCTTACAHAVLQDARPADGSMLAQSPAEVRLRFDEPVVPIALAVLDHDGRRIAALDHDATATAEVRLALPPHLADGFYVVSYRVVSTDAHVVGGSYTFAVGSTNASTAGTGGANGAANHGMHGAAHGAMVGAIFAGAPLGAWAITLLLARALVYAGVLLAVGGALFAASVTGQQPDGRDRRDIVLAALAAVLASGVQLIATGALAVGPGADAALARLWHAGAATSLLPAALASGGGLALAVAGSYSRLPPARVILLSAGAIVAAGGLALTGHAASAPPAWLAAPVVAAHVLAAAFWIGSLLPLWRRLARPGPAATAALTRFSSLAIAAVTLLVACGVVLAWLQLGSFAALAGSSYGRVLLAKIGLVLGLIALAAVNRLHHLPRLCRDGQAPRRLQRLILLEIGVALLVIAITAALGQLVPPRALHHAATGVGEHRAVTQTVLAASGRRAELALDPGRRGTNSLTVTLTTPDGAVLPVLELVARVANPALGIEPHAYALALRSPGRYAIQDVQMSAAGTWRITLDATIGEFESDRFDATFVLR